MVFIHADMSIRRTPNFLCRSWRNSWESACCPSISRDMLSDSNLNHMEKSITLDIEELADNLQLGSKFCINGFSMGAEITWSCLKHIPHRFTGVAILG
ncbi:hypothetical protein GUJ93_ZPchr0014g47276 [Zizania palustris]|uniref:Uncharacterized protein n=1 Tax=Zizania palustris TaxID=103762 RepID=A0A8J5VUP9_ZIZPA|nr:hypothetical protein GUJ93_ZPchr0014g47276 [Zizania palustris]